MGGGGGAGRGGFAVKSGLEQGTVRGKTLKKAQPGAQGEDGYTRARLDVAEKVDDLLADVGLVRFRCVEAVEKQHVDRVALQGRR